MIVVFSGWGFRLLLFLLQSSFPLWKIGWKPRESRACPLRTECLLFPLHTFRADLPLRSPLQPLQAGSVHLLLLLALAVCGRRLGSQRRRRTGELGYIVGLSHGNHNSKRNRSSLVRLCKWPRFSPYLGTPTLPQTTGSPGKVKLGPALPSGPP